ncbi:MAG: hypothetical protein KDE33_28685 [Bacteroidetes bacterium]|nr:hypothetical protein [Bacteroidota bacterium]
MSYPWFEILNDGVNSLEQGDFIPNCPILIPPNNIQDNQEVEIEVKQIDSIILSQSCDLVNDKIEIVLVCPFYSLQTFLSSLSEEQQSKNSQKKIVENLRKGYLAGYHLLNNDTNIESLQDYQIVDFRNVYGIQIQSLREITTNLTQRIRLLPPYREHLSQAFARYFMRVGLPQDITVEGY